MYPLTEDWQFYKKEFSTFYTFQLKNGDPVTSSQNKLCDSLKRVKQQKNLLPEIICNVLLKGAQ